MTTKKKLIDLNSELLKAKARIERYKFITNKLLEVNNKATDLTPADQIFFAQVICQIYNLDYIEYKETEQFYVELVSQTLLK